MYQITINDKVFMLSADQLANLSERMQDYTMARRNWNEVTREYDTVLLNTRVSLATENTVRFIEVK